jgi:hypothetical protein
MGTHWLWQHCLTLNQRGIDIVLRSGDRSKTDTKKSSSGVGGKKWRIGIVVIIQEDIRVVLSVFSECWNRDKKMGMGMGKRPGMLDVGNPQCFITWYLHASTDQTAHPKSRNIALSLLNRHYLDFSLDWKSPGPFFPHLIGCPGHYAHLWRLLISRQSEMYSCISLCIYCHKEYDRSANPVATSYCIMSSYFPSPFLYCIFIWINESIPTCLRHVINMML